MNPVITHITSKDNSIIYDTQKFNDYIASAVLKKTQTDSTSIARQELDQEITHIPLDSINTSLKNFHPDYDPSQIYWFYTVNTFNFIFTNGLYMNYLLSTTTDGTQFTLKATHPNHLQPLFSLPNAIFGIPSEGYVTIVRQNINQYAQITAKITTGKLIVSVTWPSTAMPINVADFLDSTWTIDIHPKFKYQEVNPPRFKTALEIDPEDELLYHLDPVLEGYYNTIPEEYRQAVKVVFDMASSAKHHSDNNTGLILKLNSTLESLMNKYDAQFANINQSFTSITAQLAHISTNATQSFINFESNTGSNVFSFRNPDSDYTYSAVKDIDSNSTMISNMTVFYSSTQSHAVGRYVVTLDDVPSLSQFHVSSIVYIGGTIHIYEFPIQRNDLPSSIRTVAVLYSYPVL